MAINKDNMYFTGSPVEIKNVLDKESENYIIEVTGYTGDGATTTVYWVRSWDRNRQTGGVLTIEDMVFDEGAQVVFPNSRPMIYVGGAKGVYDSGGKFVNDGTGSAVNFWEWSKDPDFHTPQRIDGIISPLNAPYYEGKVDLNTGFVDMSGDATSYGWGMFEVLMGRRSAAIGLSHIYYEIGDNRTKAMAHQSWVWDNFANSEEVNYNLGPRWCYEGTLGY